MDNRDPKNRSIIKGEFEQFKHFSLKINSIALSQINYFFCVCPFTNKVSVT